MQAVMPGPACLRALGMKRRRLRLASDFPWPLLRSHVNSARNGVQARPQKGGGIPSDLPPLPGRRDVALLAVLRHSSPRDVDADFLELGDDLVVVQRVVLVLVVDDAFE